MTKEEFIKTSGLKVGDIITTQRGKLRELHKFVEKSNTVWGMKFLGIDSKSKHYNSIKKFIYSNELEDLIISLKKKKNITFKEVGNFVNSEKKGGCVTHTAIEIITKHLKIGEADYIKKIVYLN
jgi:hypothetical protein